MAQLPPIQLTTVSAPPVRPAAVPPRRAVEAVAADVKVDVLSATPPPEALEAVDRAAEIAERLAASGRQLSFRVDEDTRRVIVEVMDLNGKVLRTIPPSEALEWLS